MSEVRETSGGVGLVVVVLVALLLVVPCGGILLAGAGLFVYWRTERVMVQEAVEAEMRAQQASDQLRLQQEMNLELKRNSDLSSTPEMSDPGTTNLSEVPSLQPGVVEAEGQVPTLGNPEAAVEPAQGLPLPQGEGGLEGGSGGIK